MSKAVFSCLSACAWTGFFLIRFAERILPLRALSVLLWPAAAIWGAVEIRKRRRALAAWRKLAAVLPAPNGTQVWFWQAIAAHHVRFAYLFPDRLGESRWLRRCEVTGPTSLVTLRQSEGRIVFASIHFGAFDTLPYLLRAHGLPVTTLVGRTAPRHRLKERQYSLSPPPELPVVLPVVEMANLRQALAKVRHLLVLMDVDRGRQIEIEWDGVFYRLATGAIRIAAANEAELVPCLTTVRAGWRFNLHLGTPVPRSYLGPSPDLKAAALHLLREFLEIVRQAPAQSGYRFLSCIRGAEEAALSAPIR